MTAITLQHVSKQFPTQTFGGKTITALDNLSLKLTSGDVLAILGPSGCGKSTLLRIVAGLIAPDSGQVFYDNVLLNEIPMSERGIGMVFQEGALMPHWTSGQSVSFFLRLRHREHEVPERVRRISKITGIGIEVLLGRRPKELSGGERQRVSIARALTRDMRVLLFDEPFANLDFKVRNEARIELKRLLHEFPITSIYVTHDQVEAVALSHRIAVMRDGHVEQIGTYQQLYTSPMNLFVAGFVGTPLMNLFAGRIEDGHWHGETFGGYPVRADLPNDTQVTMGIRPEHFRITSDGMPAVVNTVTPYFAERYQLVEVWLGSEHWSLIMPLEGLVDVGSTVYCLPNPEAMHFFDTQTGARIG
jgi:ABC-type sugar transport system ATPase subunit